MNGLEKHLLRPQIQEAKAKCRHRLLYQTEKLPSSTGVDASVDIYIKIHITQL